MRKDFLEVKKKFSFVDGEIAVGLHCKYTMFASKKSRKVTLHNYVKAHFLLLQNYVKYALWGLWVRFWYYYSTVNE